MPNRDHIPGGYILKARKTLDSELMDKPPLYSKLWDWMLLRAEWREGKRLKRGQFHTTIAEMQEAMSWHVGFRKITPTKKEIRAAYEWLSRKSDEGHAKGTMIGTTKGTRGMVITVQNYEFYQDPKSYEGHSEGHDEKSTKVLRRAQDSKEVEERRRKHSSDNSATADSSAAKQFPDEYREFVDSFVAFVVKEHGALAPRVTPALISSSLDTVDKLVRIDGHSFEAVKAAMRWAVRDSFWSKNALSLAGLRKKRDGLTKFQRVLARFEDDQSPGQQDTASWQKNSFGIPVTFDGQDWIDAHGNLSAPPKEVAT